MFRNRRLLKSISVTILTVFVVEMFAPLAIKANNTSQPEFAGGSSMNSELVDTFTGQFHYSVPLLEVPGTHGASYPVVLNYNSGSGPESDASWVGYGWSLNSGSIARNKRGFADDMFNEEIHYYNKTEDITTVAVGPTLSTNVELFDNKAFGDLGLGGNFYIRHNTVKGFSTATGFFASALGMASLGLNISDGDIKASYSFNINPLQLLKLSDNWDKKAPIEKTIISSYPSLMSIGGEIGGTEPPRPTNVSTVQGDGYAINLSSLLSVFTTVGGDPGLYGMIQTLKTTPKEMKNGYGNMYTPYINEQEKGPQSKNFSHAIMDYSVERESPYHTQKTTHLYAPFSSPDNFMVSAHGLGGSFRLHHNATVEYRPNRKENGIDFHNITVQPVLPKPPPEPPTPPPPPNPLNQTYGISGSSDPSSTKMFIGKSEYFKPDIHHSDNGFFFRFQNDLGGKIIKSSSDAPAIPSFKKDKLEPTYYYKVNRGRTAGATSYVGYNTNSDLETGSSSLATRAYSKSGTREQFVYNTGGVQYQRLPPSKQQLLQKQIGEFSVVNADGNRYNFGLPVYSRNEVTVSYDVQTPPDAGKNIVKKSVSLKGFKDAEVANGNVKVVKGEAHPDPYPSSYLLTEITTPDYVDRAGDGPSKDDFGGWVKFNYTRLYGSTNKFVTTPDPWFKWRSPFAGLRYQQNSLANTKDDMGSVVYGEREVYVLQSIETATHIAVFKTKDRLDGYAAPQDEAAASNWNPLPFLSQKSKYLEKIDLYVYQADGQLSDVPLRSVYFAYDYSAWPGVPDNYTAPSGNTGKLTLRKIWFESMGVKNAELAPYEFYYRYQGDNQSQVEAKANEFASYFSSAGCANTDVNGIIGNWEGVLKENQTGSLQQKPSYAPELVDKWGSYREAPTTNVNASPYLQQFPSKHFDAAAWQLKMIRLPSGGEIHVEYEQQDYQYVQNRPAMRMMKVTAKNNSAPDNAEKAGKVVYISDQELFGPTATVTSAMRANAKDIIEKQFIQGGERAYFKFLFHCKSLFGDGTDCSYKEYINGYARIHAVTAINSVALPPAIPEPLGIKITLGDGTTGINSTHPSQAGKEYQKSMNQSPNCKPIFSTEGKAPAAIMYSFLALQTTIVTSLNTLINSGGAPPVVFNDDNNASYLRLPTIIPKKGGGVRVHRIISISPASLLEPGRGKISGVEYCYETVDENGITISSGVATNEPNVGEEENSIVRLTEENIPGLGVNDIVAGENISYFEGPIGMQLLPAPSIGYSRVIVKSICDKATSPGFQVSDFYTVKDFPSVTLEKTPLQVPVRTERSPITIPLLPHSEENLAACQGYAFNVSTVHGSAKATYSYGGPYTKGVFGQVRSTPQFQGSPSASTTYRYYLNEDNTAVADEVPVMYDPDRPIRMESLGKEMETFVETRRVTEDITNYPTHVTAAINLGFSPAIIPIIHFFPYAQRRTDKIDIMVSNKIITRPVFLKSVETRTADGIDHLSENIAFEANTGRPAIVRTSDSYHGIPIENNGTHAGYYTAYTVPACSHYPEMGQVAKSERFTVASMQSYNNIKCQSLASPSRIKFSIAGLIGTSASDKVSVSNSIGILEELHNTFSKNDLVLISSLSGKFSDYSNVLSVGNLVINGVNSYFECECAGGILSLPDARVQIVRSGKSNQLGATAENVSVYGDTDINKALVDAKILSKRTKVIEDMNDGIDVGYRMLLSSIAGPHPVFIRPIKQFPTLYCTDEHYRSTTPPPSEPNTEPIPNCATPVSNFGDALEYDKGTGNVLYPQPIDIIDWYWSWVYYGNTIDNYCSLNAQGNPPGLTPPFIPVADYFVNYINQEIELSTSSLTMGWSHQNWPWTKDMLNDPSNHQFDYWGTDMKWDAGLRSTSDPQPNKWESIIPRMRIYQPTNQTTLQAKQQVPASGLGQEWFHVNDKGEMVFTHFLNTLTQPRNIAFLFRVKNMSTPYDVTENIEGSNLFGLNTAILNPDANNKCVTSMNLDNKAINRVVDDCDFPELALPRKAHSKIVAASVQTYSDIEDHSATTPVKTGKWRPYTSFTYDAEGGSGAVAGKLTSILDGGTPTPKIYATGIAPGNFTRFDFTASSNPAWTKETEIVKYSPHGGAITTVDVLGIKSSVKSISVFDNPTATAPRYGEALPGISGWNATEEDLFFESCEQKIPVTSGGIYRRNSAIAHTGDQFISLGNSDTYEIDFTGTSAANPYLLQFWFSYDNDGLTPVPNPSISVGGTPVVASVTPIRSGKWLQYSVEVSISGITTIALNNPVITSDLYLDDIKIQPKQAKTTATVYDRYQHPRAVLDDNHFATITQYDGQGVPVRTVRETERGFFTITDQHANVPLQLRSSVISNLYTSSQAPSTPLPMMMKTPNPYSYPAVPPKGSEKVQEWDQKFDVMELELTPDKQRLKVLGVDSVDKLFDAKRMKEMYKLPHQVPSTDSLGIEKKIKQVMPSDTLLQRTPDSSAGNSWKNIKNTLQKK